MSKVLVTGGSGFLAGHCISHLLKENHHVRVTLRDVGFADDVRTALEDSREGGGRLEFVAAELTSDSGWMAATKGCDYVLHVASPFPPGASKHQDDLIRPAREGTERVLRAARDAGVRRVVMTSSFAAIGYGHPPQVQPFTEADWTDVSGADVEPYIKSKTLAEKAAWKFIAQEGGGLELAVINPVGIFGPLLRADVRSSLQIIKGMLDGEMPLAPRVSFGVVDVRDVAALHVTAMTHSSAAGQRFLAVSGEPLSMMQVGMILRHKLGKNGRRAPRMQAPDMLVRLLAVFSPALRQVVPQLGLVRRSSGTKAFELLGWSPRPNEEAIVAAGESLLRLGLINAASS